MNLPSNFVKQTYDLRNEKGYATADTFFLNRLIELIKEYKITTIVEAGVFHGRSTVEMSYLVDEGIGIDIFSKMLESKIRGNVFVVELPNEIKNNFENFKIVLRNGQKLPEWIKFNLDFEVQV